MKFSGMIDYIMLHILSYFFTWFGKKRGGVQKKGGQNFLSQEGVRALARAQIYLSICGGSTFDTNTHFLPIFRIRLQPNRSMNVRKNWCRASPMLGDYLYKFLALYFNGNISFLGFENRDFGKFH